MTVSMLPTFLVIGAMKAGTTSLHAYLAAHPDVFMATPKELSFFVEGKNWERGLEWYAEHFATTGGATARGEASPDYSKADVFPGVPWRIAQALPDARLVYVVRDPVERMRSMYAHEVSAGRETRSIARALRDHPHYRNTSRYAWQLDQYRPYFPREQILVVTSEELRDRRRPTLRRVFEFVAVDPGFVPPDVDEERGRRETRRAPRRGLRRLRRLLPVHGGMQRLPAGLRNSVERLSRSGIREAETALPADLEAELVEILAPDVRRLRDEYLGPDFDGWGLL